MFRWEPSADTFTYLGRSFVLEKIGKATGKDVEFYEEEMRRKAAYLTLMNKLNMTYYKDVSQAIASYYVDAGEAIQRLEKKAAG